MKLGAEPKKVVILAGLVLVAGYLVFFGGDDGPPHQQASGTAATPRAPRSHSPASTARAAAGAPRNNRGRSRGAPQFRPSLKPARPEDRPDPMTIDPTLRLNLLAKLQDVSVGDVHRSLFEFSKPPAPKKAEEKLTPARLAEIRKKQEAAKKLASKKTGPPPPPPIRLKFYGFIDPVHVGDKRAFFLDGDDIFVAAEGDVVKKGRYRIVKIGVNSAVVEDTRHRHKQTLKLEEATG